MIRTGIFVHQRGPVAIATPDDPRAQLRHFGDPGTWPAAGTHDLKPGIYLIVTVGEISVRGGPIEVVTLREDKAPLPVPNLKVQALEPGATPEAIQLFFTIAKSADAPDEPAAEEAGGFESDGGGEDDG
jgi:hypothetical protein